MKTRIKFFAFAIVGLAMAGCMQQPQGEKAQTSDVYKVSEKVKGDSYTANIQSSSIEWLGTKPTGTHWGTVMLSEGKVYVDGKNVTGGSFTIDLNSIVVLDIEDPGLNGRLLGHLKSADFFFVDSFPTATFQIANIEKYSGNADQLDGFTPTHTVKGNLTMRGNTKGVAFPASIEISSGLITVKTPQFLINRTLWGVNYGSKSLFAELKDNFIHDEMGIKINFEAKK